MMVWVRQRGVADRHGLALSHLRWLGWHGRARGTCVGGAAVDAVSRRARRLPGPQLLLTNMLSPGHTPSGLGASLDALLNADQKDMMVMMAARKSQIPPEGLLLSVRRCRRLVGELNRRGVQVGRV